MKNGNTDNAVIIKDLGKSYKLYNLPQDRLKEAFSFGLKKYHKEFWALHNINLEIPKGKTVGIIGRNGSGKSTLLKIITSILQPTIGTIRTQGKIAALLELGTGFNPEFTGKQNIILNCTMQGLSSKQTKDLIPQIEAFADIGDFIHQPLKTYSSGMQMRLGFAAAIHSDPDILIVDEALAVGDVKFQQKCYQKFLDFQKAGKTILLVTHDLHAITRYCSMTVLLEAGEVIHYGEPRETVSMYSELLSAGKIKNKQYDKFTEQNNSVITSDVQTANDDFVSEFISNDNNKDDVLFKNPLYNKNEYRFGNKKAKIIDAIILTNNSKNMSLIKSEETADIYIKVLYKKKIDNPVIVGVDIKTPEGTSVYAINTRFLEVDLETVKINEIKVYKFSIKLNVCPGDWFLDLGLAEKVGEKDEQIDARFASIHFMIEQSKRFDGLSYLHTDFEEIKG